MLLLPERTGAIRHSGSEIRRNGSQRAPWYDRRAMVLLAFLVGLATVVVGTTFAVVRGVSLWRQAKRTGGTIASELSSFEERAARAERNLAEWDRASSDLE